MNNKIFSKVYMWMFIGLLVSFITGYYVSTNQNMLYNIFSTNMYWIIFIIEIIAVIYLSARIQKMSLMTARVVFLLYSFLTGLSLSLVFVMFKLNSIIFVFGITGLIFGIFALIGYFTKIDLTKFGTILFMALIGIILASIINIFIGSETFDLIICIMGIIIFMLYIAYDMQKIKMLSNQIGDEDKLAIIGALELYLDFINLFYRLISLFGVRRD